MVMAKHVVIAAACVLLAGAAVVGAHAASTELPAGPIRDRHDLMEQIGKQAKVVGDAVKAGDSAPVGAAAAQIQADAGKILALFPPGSADPRSRAKAEIWTNWAEFSTLTQQLQTDAGALAAAAPSQGDLKAAANTMFSACKGCHDKFREPEKSKTN